MRNPGFLGGFKPAYHRRLLFKINKITMNPVFMHQGSICAQVVKLSSKKLKKKILDKFREKDKLSQITFPYQVYPSRPRTENLWISFLSADHPALKGHFKIERGEIDGF
jgi:hypothetical protein